jgi:class 3 adenylate cyclase
MMDYNAVLAQVLALLQQEKRVAYRVLKRQFQLDDELLEDLKDDLIYAKKLAVDEDGRVLVWTGAPGATAPAATAPAPLTYTLPYLAEKILTSRSALEGERKQVTVLFADLKGSMELLAERDPEEARQLLDPVLERMMAAVHQYEGTVNQVMGDGIMALFGAPLAHEDHAVRACYAALRMQETIKQYAAEVQRSHGAPLHIRVGLNAGEVVVRSIGSDLHMDYTAVGQTTHLAARMEQMAMPGSILITPAVLGLVEGFVQVKALGTMPVRGLRDPVEVYEVTGAGVVRSRLQAAAQRAASPALWDGNPSWRPCNRPWRRRRLDTAKWWPWSARPAWGSRGCSMSLATPTTPRAGCCSKAPRCRMARRHRISPWLTS